MASSRKVIIKNAIKGAQAHCQSNTAAYIGTDAFIKDIEILNVTNVKGELLLTKSVVENAESTFEEQVASTTSSDTRYAVTRGGAEGEAEYMSEGYVAAKVGDAPESDAKEKVRELRSKVQGAINEMIISARLGPSS